MKTFANIFKWVQLAIAATAIVEGTIANSPGETKRQHAIDIINNEAPLVDAVLPNFAGLDKAIINMTVSMLNSVGLFGHNPATPPIAIGAAK